MDHRPSTIQNGLRKFGIVLIAAVIMLSSCASSKHKPHKKLKPGKPIPCPQKDC